MVRTRNKKNYPLIIIKYSSYLELWQTLLVGHGSKQEITNSINGGSHGGTCKNLNSIVAGKDNMKHLHTR